MSKIKIKDPKPKPMRTCIVTRKKLPKTELLRLVLDEDGLVTIDMRGKMKGRGANISPDMDVLEQAFAKRAIERALKINGSMSDESKDVLRNEFQKAIDEKNFRPHNKPVSIRIKKDDLKRLG